MLFIAFLIALTIDVKTASIGCQVAIFVNKQYFFVCFWSSWFKKFNISWLLHKLLIYELNKWVSSITVLTLPPPKEFCNFWSTFLKVKFLLELLGHFLSWFTKYLRKSAPNILDMINPHPLFYQKLQKKKPWCTKSGPTLLDCIKNPTPSPSPNGRKPNNSFFFDNVA